MQINKIGFLSVISLLCLLPTCIHADVTILRARPDAYSDVPYVPGGVPRTRILYATEKRVEKHEKEENDPAVTAALLDFRDKLEDAQKTLKNRILRIKTYHRHTRITPDCSSCEEIQTLKGKEEVNKRVLEAVNDAQKINSRNKRFHFLAAELY
ncbi:MAG TPA: hypothetical protein VGT41_01490 [Candidatus Babeliales bacterium]|nr:hypothetical protein [Candidatus Babeliales bacterium]